MYEDFMWLSTLTQHEREEYSQNVHSGSGETKNNSNLSMTIDEVWTDELIWVSQLALTEI